MEIKALEQLYREHYRQLLAEARAILYEDEEARDVVSEVFAELLRRRPAVAEGNEKAYLFQSVRNRCRNVIARKTLTERVTHLYALEQSRATEEEEEEHVVQLRSVIQRWLTPRQRTVFELRFGDEMKYREIASELGISETAVYQHLVAALRQIKEHYKPFEYGNK